jgi:peroxiredoxin
VAKRYGVSFILSKPLRPIHEQFGMDIPAHNGNDSFELPLAATYVIGRDGIIRYSFVSANWMERAEITDVVAIVKDSPGA